MKSLQKAALATALIMVFASCQPSTDVTQTLSKPDTRKEMMDKIANDSSMSKEMMGAMINSQNGKMMMQQHQTMMMGDNSSMMKMMKENPDMMHNMIMNMMEACKNDTTMMSGICKAMMGNKPMMDMMQKMNGKMNGMDTIKAIDHKSHH